MGALSCESHSSDYDFVTVILWWFVYHGFMVGEFCHCSYVAAGRVRGVVINVAVIWRGERLRGDYIAVI